MKKILYFECKTGAAGDMIMGALYSLLDENQQKEFLNKLNTLYEGVHVIAEPGKSKGISGIHMRVAIHGKDEHDHLNEACCEGHMHADHHKSHHSHNHSHSTYQSVMEKMHEFGLNEFVVSHASKIYELIGTAESKVHGSKINQIHFHEVGDLDAVFDIIGCCMAIDMLGVDEIIASPICVGNGTVRCAHGILPVPAPATAEIIKGIPVYTSYFDAELLTPTGAAIIKHFASAYVKEIDINILNVGYGIGTKEFEQASFVRIFLGNTY